jgi:hypothetical protein
MSKDAIYKAVFNGKMEIHLCREAEPFLMVMHPERSGCDPHPGLSAGILDVTLRHPLSLLARLERSPATIEVSELNDKSEGSKISLFCSA